jgi:hypothetical protein
MKFRTILLGISALCIAIAAAYFSITGLSKLFAGASTAVILMASSLEFGKLISASFLYVYWNKINKFLRTYLVMGVIVLILITSAGIYGFLTSAYQTTADSMGIMDKQVEIVELKRNRFEEQLLSATVDKDRITQSISELTNGLSNNVIRYKDKDGNVLTTTSSATRRALESQLADSKTQRDNLSIRIETLSDSVTQLDINILNLQKDNEVAAEIGTLKYLSEITGQPMSVIVNWFALFIVFVFDPLAVTLVIAFNTALRIDKGERVINDTIGIKTKPIDSELTTVMNDMINSKVGNSPTKPRFETPSIEKSNDTIISDYELDYSDISDDEELYKPNERLVKAAEDYKRFQTDGLYTGSKVETDVVDMDDKKKVDDVKTDIRLQHIKRDFTKRAIDTDGDGIYDGYDTDGDGLINIMRPSSSARWRYAESKTPYYSRVGFDWNDVNKWINDQNAINYYLTYINPKSQSKYPDNFDSKIY